MLHTLKTLKLILLMILLQIPMTLKDYTQVRTPEISLKYF